MPLRILRFIWYTFTSVLSIARNIFKWAHGEVWLRVRGALRDLKNDYVRPFSLQDPYLGLALVDVCGFSGKVGSLFSRHNELKIFRRIHMGQEGHKQDFGLVVGFLHLMWIIQRQHGMMWIMQGGIKGFFNNIKTRIMIFDKLKLMGCQTYTASICTICSFLLLEDPQEAYSFCAKIEHGYVGDFLKVFTNLLVNGRNKMAKNWDINS